MAMVSGARPAGGEDSMRLSMARSYGTSAGGVEGRRAMFVQLLVWGMILLTGQVALAQGAGAAKPIKMVVLGDSLSAGFGLPGPAAFPARLQKTLKHKGI